MTWKGEKKTLFILKERRGGKEERIIALRYLWREDSTTLKISLQTVKTGFQNLFFCFFLPQIKIFYLLRICKKTKKKKKLNEGKPWENRGEKGEVEKDGGGCGVACRKFK